MRPWRENRVYPPGALARRRFLLRSAFFALFVLAPPLDLFRLDLTLGHFILFGHDWTLGIADLQAGRITPAQAALNIVTRAFIPLFGAAALFIFAAWRWGRLYCGWLCPHFSVVELINALMRRASGKPSLWEPHALPERLPDGRVIVPDRRFWLPTLLAVLGFALLWAIALLTYLLPPAQVYGHLMHLEPTRGEAIFIGVGTVLLALEFLLARHLFCRFGCAVGLFQSLAWMGNHKAMVVGFDTARAGRCADCDAACENACPMRLKPRAIKRRMFTCTQCAQCVDACTEVTRGESAGPLLQWLEGECARQVSERDFGHHPPAVSGCFRSPLTPGARESRQARSTLEHRPD